MRSFAERQLNIPSNKCYDWIGAYINIAYYLTMKKSTDDGYMVETRYENLLPSGFIQLVTIS